MTKTITMTAPTFAIAAVLSLSAGGALAGDAYQVFTAGNPDSNGNRSELLDVVAAPPGVGTDIDRYQGIADGNGDLTFEIGPHMSREHELPGIYSGFGGYPDAQF
jgi:hypothetical protein